MSILGKFTKQPNEVLDYDVDYTDFFSIRTDQPVSFTVVMTPGITLAGSARVDKVVKVVLSGGEIGKKYKITVRLATDAGVVKEADFEVLVKEF